MNNDTTIEFLRLQKDAAESRLINHIGKTIREFEEQTGIQVEDINVNIVHIKRIEDEPNRYKTIVSDVNLSLDLGDS